MLYLICQMKIKILIIEIRKYQFFRTNALFIQNIFVKLIICQSIYVHKIRMITPIEAKLNN